MRRAVDVITELARCAGVSLGLILMVANCSDAVGPLPRVGDYDLTLLDGNPAPFILSDDHFAAGNRIVVEQVADSIQIASPTALIRAQRFRDWFYAADGSLDTLTSAWSSSATYHLFGQRMIIAYPDLGQPTPPETLQVTESGALLGHRLITGWCVSGQPPECPTVPHMSTFTYERR